MRAIRDWLGSLTLPVFGVVFLLAWPTLTNHVSALSGKANYYTDLGTVTLVSVMLVYSLNLAMGYSGLLSLMHTGFLGVGGYMAGYLATRHGLPIWVGIIAALLSGALVGAIASAVSLRATYLYFGVITLSLNVVLGEVAKEWKSVTLGEDGMNEIPNRVKIIDGVATPTSFHKWFDATPRYFIVLGVTMAVYVIHRNLVRSRTGRSFQAVRESGDAANALAIRTSTTKVLAFALSGAIAALAGVFWAYHRGSMQPSTIQPGDTITLFGGLLLGGTATQAGPFIGVVLFRFVVEIVNNHLVGNHPVYAPLILGGILWLLLVFAPKGIVGSWQESRFGSSRRRPRATPPSESSHTAPAVDALGWARARTAELRGPILEARGVVKSFGGIKALQGVDVSVDASEVHGIIGPNGSGKSTFVSAATAFLHRDSGTVTIFGQPAAARPDLVAASGVVRVFQVPHLFERVSVLDNVLTGMHKRSQQHWWSAALRLPGWFADERSLREEGRSLLALAGLGDKADWLAASLSHGQKRLLEVARAVGAHPRILILDEPATGLTSEEVASLADLIRTLKAGGLTIVLIEHNVQFVMSVCDRVTVFEQGRVIATGAPAEIQANEDVQRAYLGASDVAELIGG